MKNQIKFFANFGNFLALRPRPHQGLCLWTPAGGCNPPATPAGAPSEPLPLDPP